MLFSLRSCSEGSLNTHTNRSRGTGVPAAKLLGSLVLWCCTYERCGQCVEMLSCQKILHFLMHSWNPLAPKYWGSICSPTILLDSKLKKAMPRKLFSACLIDMSVYEHKVLSWQPGSLCSEKPENVQSDLRGRLDKISADMCSRINSLIPFLSWVEPERGWPMISN